MGEENIDIEIPSEEIEPDMSDVIKISQSPVEEHSDNDKEQMDIDRDVNANESADWLADENTDVVKEEGEGLTQNHQTVDDMNGQLSLAEVTGSPGPSRRSPTTVIVGADHKFTVRSRYRRASMGSCHDSCKYGHKHEAEKVNRKPLMGIIRENKPLTRTTSVSGGDFLAKSVHEKESKDKSMLRRLSLPGILEKDPPSRTDRASSSRKVAPSPTQSKGKRVQSVTKSPSLSSFSRSKAEISAVKKTPQEKSGQKVKEIKTKEVGSSSESKKASSSESKTGKAKEPIIKSSRTPLKKSGSIKARLYKDVKSSSRSRHQSFSENVKGNKSSNVLEKAVDMVDPSASSSRAGKASKSSPSIGGSPSTQSEPHADRVKKSNVSKKGTRFGLSSFSAPFTSKSAASTSRRTGQPQGDYRQKADASNTKTIGPITEAGGSKPRTPRSKPAVNLKTKAKKTESSRPEEKDSSAWKVKFRRGTVVNLQVANNAPRRLRFKRARILGDQTSKADADKNLKNTDGTKDEPDVKPEREKVQLRRQEASGKKDSVDLNDVIEETASKLVKTRKSKVKALVGAFETVMSFRDRKPLVETGAS